MMFFFRATLGKKKSRGRCSMATAVVWSIFT
jgi:hypothetical protein